MPSVFKISLCPFLFFSVYFLISVFNGTLLTWQKIQWVSDVFSNTSVWSGCWFSGCDGVTGLSVSLLQEEARRHFSCPILEGMELENQGGTGTELNHWEKRLLEVRTFSPTPLRFTKRQTNPTCSFLLVIPHDSLQNEAMTGSHTQNRVFSRLTLAIMEDSGWYRANYSLAQRLDWGHGLGCDFVMKSCKFWMDRQRQRCCLK